MYNIVESAKELKNYYALQDTPYPLRLEDYIKIVVRAIKKYYVDRNHPEEFDYSMFTVNEKEEVCFDYDFNILQEDYIFMLSKIDFLRIIISDVSGDAAVSYTTNALSVTGAKEAYKSVQQEIDDLESERIRVFHKLMAHEES